VSLDLSQIGVEAGLVSVIVTFAGKWLFATKGELANSAAEQRTALEKHASEERTRIDTKFERLFDKVDGMRDDLSDLRVEIANGNRYARRRASDPDPT
jgi:hypothetical protein